MALKKCVLEENKTNGSEKQKKKKKKLSNLLAALLIELPQHFTRGWSGKEIGWIDTDTRSHTLREKKKAAHTQKGNASDKLSSVVFFDKFD